MQFFTLVILSMVTVSAITLASESDRKKTSAISSSSSQSQQRLIFNKDDYYPYDSDDSNRAFKDFQKVILAEQTDFNAAEHVLLPLDLIQTLTPEPEHWKAIDSILPHYNAVSLAALDTAIQKNIRKSVSWMKTYLDGESAAQAIAWDTLTNEGILKLLETEVNKYAPVPSEPDAPKKFIPITQQQAYNLTLSISEQASIRIMLQNKVRTLLAAKTMQSSSSSSSSSVTE